MKRRLVSFGCSHAFGVEMHGRGIQHHDDNFSLNYANLVAQRYNLDFKIAARPGNSNKQILHDVIELVQPNDICLLAWTYGERSRYIKVENTNSHANVNFSAFHALKVLYDNNPSDAVSNVFTKLFGWFANEPDRVSIDSQHYFLNSPSDKNKMAPLINFCQSYYQYYNTLTIRVLDFLEIYHAVNAIIKQRGATAVNFHFSTESETINGLKFPETLSADFVQADQSYNSYKNSLQGFSKNNLDKILVHDEDKACSQLFDYYNQDTSKLTWQIAETDAQPLSFVDWYMREYYNNYQHDWPDNRMGHLGPNAHEVLSNTVINHLEDKI